MKLVIDEKLKHRIIGVAVIISLGAIFAPAMMKKSSQNMESNYSVRVKLPSKPEEPNVAITDEKEVFKTIRISKVDIPEVSAESQLPKLAKAEAIHSDIVAQHEMPSIKQPNTDTNFEVMPVASNDNVSNTVKQSVQVVTKTKSVVATNKAFKKPAVVVSKPKPQVAMNSRPTPSKPAVRADIYAVQLASFSQLSNAQALVNKLKNKGYKANFARVASRSGVIYKVYAGHSPRKDEVVRLKTQLASAMQLNGFVVNTGVS